MKGCVLNYYFMMDCLKRLPISATEPFPKDNSIYFSLANFSSVSVYSFIYNPFKKDKYQLDKLIREHYKELLIESAIEFKNNMEESDSFYIEGILLLYGLITTNTLRDYLYPYLKAVTKDTYDLDLCLNMIDSYMANKKDTIDLTKESLSSLFPKGYTYYDSVEKLIRNPMVKLFRFMGTNAYYEKSYKKFYKAAKYSNQTGRKWDYKLFDKLFARHKEKKQYLIYTKDIDADIFNLKNNPYTLDGKELTSSFEDIFKDAREEAVKRLNALNSYLFIPKGEVEFRAVFKIDKEKKL